MSELAKCENIHVQYACLFVNWFFGDASRVYFSVKHSLGKQRHTVLDAKTDSDDVVYLHVFFLNDHHAANKRIKLSNFDWRQVSTIWLYHTKSASYDITKLFLHFLVRLYQSANYMLWFRSCHLLSAIVYLFSVFSQTLSIKIYRENSIQRYK